MLFSARFSKTLWPWNLYFFCTYIKEYLAMLMSTHWNFANRVPMRKGLQRSACSAPPFYRWRNWDLERLIYLLTRSKARFLSPGSLSRICTINLYAELPALDWATFPVFTHIIPLAPKTTFCLSVVFSYLDATFWIKALVQSRNESTISCICLCHITSDILLCNLSCVICQFSSIYFKFLEDKKYVLLSWCFP